MRKLSDTEVTDLLKSEVLWNRARRLFSTNMANICRYENLRPVELRRMEFEAVAEIADLLGVQIGLPEGPEAPGAGEPGASAP